MSLLDRFADFIGSVRYRHVELPWGRAPVWETGDGPPVVLLHGIAGSRRIFFRLASLLSARCRVIVPPLRGEESPLRDLSFQDLEEDLASLLEALDLREVTLLGVSFGGALALGYGTRGDPRVRRVIAQGAFARFPLRARDRVMLAAARLFPAGLGSAYFARRVLRGRETRRIEERAPGLGHLNVQWTRETPFATLRRRIRLIDRTDLAARLRSDLTPLTIAHGRLDTVVPFSLFERLRLLRPDARAIVWEDEGHLVPLTAPERLAGLVD